MVDGLHVLSVFADLLFCDGRRCVVMDCDGPKKVMIHDLDGSTTGRGADSSVLARAEFMNERRANPSKWTWYNIPTKVRKHAYYPCTHAHMHTCKQIQTKAHKCKQIMAHVQCVDRAPLSLIQMLYDPAPLNDPGDPGHDMSAYVERCGDSEVFTYRRHRERRALLDSRLSDAGFDVSEDDIGPGSSDNASRRALASAYESDWRQRMVFYEGDERAFYQGLTGVSCPHECSALYDPACRTARRTHKEVAYRAYGTYRDGCELDEEGNAWHCRRPVGNPASQFAGGLTPMRLLIESMDSDSTTRSLTPVALASGGFVDLMNGGWDHQRSRDCGGYACLTRLMTFHTTVARGRSYDLTFTATNPRSLRLMLPHGAGHDAHKEADRVLISIFYSNPQKLQV